MLKIEGLCKSYGPFLVLDDISFTLDKRMHVGLVGANGVGKSTMLKIIASQELADNGKISIDPGITVGYLPQMLPVLSGKTIAELIHESTDKLHQLKTRIHNIENIMSAPGAIITSSLINEYGEITLSFKERGGYDLDYQVDTIMEGLGLGQIEKARYVDTLSGGEKTRLGLAMLLLRSPDILLLDEPTNNLDNTYLEWLESYVHSYRGGVIIVSHDRHFLNKTANWIYEIDEHSHLLTKYHGNYEDFKTAKNKERIKWEEDYKRQQEEITELKRIMRTNTHKTGHYQKRRDSDKLAAHFKSERLQQATTRSIRSAQERLSHIMDDPIPKPPKQLRFKAHIESEGLKSAEVIRAEKISKSYNDTIVLQDISFTLSSNSRIVITGPNGSGKTTLLRLLIGKEQLDSGMVTWAPNINLGYLPQEPDCMQHALTVIEYYRMGLKGYEEDFIFNLVKCGLFNYDEIHKTLEQLSIGQIRKLEITRLIASEPNALILDEPTNHVSLDVLESFEAAITRFRGPVLAISHDRRFIQNWDWEIWELIDGKVFIRD